MNRTLSSTKILIFLTFMFTLLGFLCTLGAGYIRFWEIEAKEILSLFFYLIILFSILIDRSKVSLFIPFIAVAFPTPLCHFSPGVFEQQGENGIIYPFFNHVEFFFLFVLLIQEKLKIKIPKLVSFLCYGILISFLFNLLFCRDFQEVGILTTGLYTVRMLILISLFINNVTINKREFIKGICYSILFLFIESLLCTILLKLPTLTSGSLGSNTFGNICGQLTSMLLFVVLFNKRLDYNKIVVYFVIATGLFIVIASETRMALLSIILVFSLILYPRFKPSNKILLLVILCIVLYLSWNTIADLLESSGKYDFAAIFDLLKEGRNVPRTSTTSSLLTRIELWSTSSNMIKENPMTGIGFNMFDNLKDEFGFDVDVVIDPHNGYLYLLSALGLISGITFIYFLYIRPWIVYYKCTSSEIKSFCIFNMGMSICEFTNAGVFKYQIFAMLVFLTLYSYKECFNRLQIE